MIVLFTHWSFITFLSHQLPHVILQAWLQQYQRFCYAQWASSGLTNRHNMPNCLRCNVSLIVVTIFSVGELRWRGTYWNINSGVSFVDKQHTTTISCYANLFTAKPNQIKKIRSIQVCHARFSCMQYYTDLSQAWISVSTDEYIHKSQTLTQNPYKLLPGGQQQQYWRQIRRNKCCAIDKIIEIASSVVVIFVDEIHF